jgi:hypothetical protein
LSQRVLLNFQVAVKWLGMLTDMIHGGRRFEFVLKFCANMFSVFIRSSAVGRLVFLLSAAHPKTKVISTSQYKFLFGKDDSFLHLPSLMGSEDLFDTHHFLDFSDS